MNSDHQCPRTQDFQDLTKDAIRHNCTHDLISEILPGISQLNFWGTVLAISTKIDDIFILKIVVNSAQQGPQMCDFKDLTKDTLRHNCTHDDITEILSGISKLNFSGILLTLL